MIVPFPNEKWKRVDSDKCCTRSYKYSVITCFVDVNKMLLFSEQKPVNHVNNHVNNHFKGHVNHVKIMLKSCYNLLTNLSINLLNHVNNHVNNHVIHMINTYKKRYISNYNNTQIPPLPFPSLFSLHLFSHPSPFHPVSSHNQSGFACFSAPCTPRSQIL